MSSPIQPAVASNEEWEPYRPLARQMLWASRARLLVAIAVAGLVLASVVAIFSLWRSFVGEPAVDVGTLSAAIMLLGFAVGYEQAPVLRHFSRRRMRHLLRLYVVDAEPPDTHVADLVHRSLGELESEREKLKQLTWDCNFGHISDAAYQREVARLFRMLPPGGPGRAEAGLEMDTAHLEGEFEHRSRQHAVDQLLWAACAGALCGTWFWPSELPAWLESGWFPVFLGLAWLAERRQKRLDRERPTWSELLAARLARLAEAPRPDPRDVDDLSQRLLRIADRRDRRLRGYLRELTERHRARVDDAETYRRKLAALARLLAWGEDETDDRWPLRLPTAGERFASELRRLADGAEPTPRELAWLRQRPLGWSPVDWRLRRRANRLLEDHASGRLDLGALRVRLRELLEASATLGHVDLAPFLPARA